jgi:uncharacterized protein YejL (UPF0352 family)
LVCSNAKKVGRELLLKYKWHQNLIKVFCGIVIGDAILISKSNFYNEQKKAKSPIEVTLLGMGNLLSNLTPENAAENHDLTTGISIAILTY